MNLYRDLILDHYKHPRNFGEMEKPDAVGREANATCGDLIEFQLQVTRSTSSGKTSNKLQVTDIKWRGVGCAISTASASLLSERVREIRGSASWRREIREIKEKDIIKMLGGEINPARVKCATLPLLALRKALEKLER